MKIYIVWDGYWPIGAFSTLELAQAAHDEYETRRIAEGRHPIMGGPTEWILDECRDVP